jgi:alkanesulfonate monooxygenase SsuD/methylene tetrahydromethanopterin reductase-like flavin-dependent oxidoreductase (luciferase family)
MINKFHVLYVGQIELDNVGLNGTPANDRRYSDERLREAFFTARDVAQTMDELGFDVLRTAEHHFQREGYEVFPNLIQLGLWLATQTKRLKFGCGFNVLPMWHPIRLAEDYAMADAVTDGRVVMGVGRGYHTREVESFGAPLQPLRRITSAALPVKAAYFTSPSMCAARCRANVVLPVPA